MNAVFLALGAIGLYFGAEWLIRGSASMGLRYGLSKAFVGLTIVGYGTSTPELIVSLQAGWDGQSEIAIGNIVGSNICNIGLIMGLAFLVRPITFATSFGGVDGVFMCFAAILLTFCMMTTGLTRPVGLLFCLILFFYTAYTLLRSKQDDAQDELVEGADPTLPLWKDCFYIIGGLLILIGSARIFLKGSVGIAESWGVSEAVIGLTIVAVGTSLPELATSLVAAWKKHGDIALGNIVGSNIYNILGILGVVGVIAPLEQSGIAATDYGVMIAYTLVFYFLLRRGKTAGRLSGALLLGAYILYAYFLYKP